MPVDMRLGQEIGPYHKLRASGKKEHLTRRCAGSNRTLDLRSPGSGAYATTNGDA